MKIMCSDPLRRSSRFFLWPNTIDKTMLMRLPTKSERLSVRTPVFTIRPIFKSEYAM